MERVRLISYESKYKNEFRDLNLKWISKNYKVEDLDYQFLNDPENYILKDGGCILLAESNGEIIGTCSLINEGNGIYELSKMTVDERYRGHHIGEGLGKEIIKIAKDLGAKKIILYSNTTHAGNAIRLYYKLGFIKVPMDDSVWERADIKMELDLIEK
jgi:GNAT superfamily N-acetyltransferase